MTLKLDSKQTTVCKVKGPSTSPTSACVLTAPPHKPDPLSESFQPSDQVLFSESYPGSPWPQFWLPVLQGHPSSTSHKIAPGLDTVASLVHFPSRLIRGALLPPGLFWELKPHRALSNHSYWALQGDRCLLVLVLCFSIPSHLPS